MPAPSRKRANRQSPPAPSRRPDGLLVFVVASTVRLAVASSLWDLPLVRTPKLDSFELLSWARRLAAGDWAWPIVAQHAPGYPIFLAGLLTLGGGSLKAAIAMQALLGACTAVLVYAIGARLFGARAGVFAGLTYALYGPVVYIDTAMLSEGLLLFLLALSLWALSEPALTLPRAMLAGVALAGAALVRPTALFIAAALVIWLFVTRRGLRAAVCAAALAATMAPALAKSWSTAGTLAVQGYGGLNVYIGNSPLHDGRATFRLGAGWDGLNSEAARQGVRDPLAQDRYYLTKTAQEIAAQPAAFARLLAVKTLWLLQSEEPRDSHSFYFFADQSRILRYLPRWWLLFPLSLLAAVPRPGSDRDRASMPGVFLLGAAASVILLVVGFRYRMPVVLGLTVLAGAGLDRLVSLFTSRSRRGVVLAVTLCAGALGMSLLLHDPRNTNLAEEWAFTGSSLITEHRLDDADAAYRHALELDPRSGLAWDGFGLARLNADRLAKARTAFERAIAIDRDNARAVYHLALVDAREGKLTQAADGYARALALSPYDAEITGDLAAVRRRIATELAMSGHPREARDAMQAVVELTPADGDAWLDLCLLSLDVGDPDTASRALQRARDLAADPRKVTFAADALQRFAREDIKKQ